MNDKPLYHVEAPQSQIGVIGDHAHVDEIHIYGPSVPQSVHQIPDPTQTFKGREKELNELTEAIREGGVTISGVRGMGGIGKTELALKLAQRLTPSYPDAQIFVDMDGTSVTPLAPSDAMGHVIRAFHPDVELPAGESERGGLYRSVLHDKEALLLLDDAADAAQVRPLVPPASCALLVTSRRRFRLPGMHTLDLDTLEPEDARALLCEISPRISDCADQIAELCGRLPLALDVAASALAERVDLTPAEYAELLRDKRRRLDLVDASLSLSYDLLDGQLQRLWARLSVFSIPFDREAAVPVWEMEGEEALDALGELLRFSLIDWNKKLERYDLHDLARIFAYDKLEANEDPRPIHRLAAEYLNARLKKEGDTPLEMLEEVDQWEHAGAWERFARRAGALVGDLSQVGYWEEIEQRLEQALNVVREHLDKPEVEAAVLKELGIIARRSARWERAIELYEQSLETFERVGDLHGMAKVFNNLGVVYRNKGDWDRAIEMYEQSLKTKKGLGDVHGMSRTFNNLGVVYRKTGDWDRAIEMYEWSLETKERMGDVHGMAKTFNNLGVVYRKRGDWDRAIEMYERSLKTEERLGDVHGVAKTFNNLGFVYRDRGEWDRAIEVYEKSLEIKKRLGDIHGIAETYNNMGFVYSQKREWGGAIEVYGKSLEIFERVGDVHGVAQTWGNLGLVYADKGEWDRAMEMYERSLETKEGMGDVHGMAQTCNNLGLLYLQLDQADKAKPLFARAYLIFSRLSSSHTDLAAQRLVEACGSQEAADVFLAELAEESNQDE